MVGKFVLSCFSCSKQYDTDMYNYWLKENKTYNCECGGIIISNSGKVNLTSVILDTKEDLEKEEKRLWRSIKEVEEWIRKHEYEIESKYKYLSALKEKSFEIKKYIEKKDEKNVKRNRKLEHNNHDLMCDCMDCIRRYGG